MLPDSVLETTTSTGTGNIALAGAVAGFVTVSARLADGQSDIFLIEAVDSNLNPTGDWEICRATYRASGNQLTGRSVIRSSNSNNLVNFSAGTKTVTIVQDPRALRLPNNSSLPSSPQVGDMCLFNGTEYICLTAGTWTPRGGGNITWETPTLTSGFTYSLSNLAAEYLILVEQRGILEPSGDYTTSGNTFTITNAFVQMLISAGAALRAVRLPSGNSSLPAGFYPDVPPASPHALNIEGGSLSGLTEYDFGNLYSLNLLGPCISIRTDTAPSGFAFGGAYFDFPSGSQWTMFAKLGYVGNYAATDLRRVKFGVALLGGTGNPAQLLTFTGGWTGPSAADGRNTTIEFQLFANYQTESVNYLTRTYSGEQELPKYFRLTRNGSTYSFWYSQEGTVWICHYSFTPPFTPVKAAVVFSNNANLAGLGAAVHIYHVRFTESAAIDQAYPGRWL